MTQVSELLKLGNDTFPCKVIPIAGNGSCLFSSISYLLCGNVQSSSVVRQAVVDYIISNWDRFKVFSHDHQGNNYPTCKAYKTAMLNSVTYGSASELKTCLFTSSSPVPLKTRRVGQQCPLNLSRAETSSRWCGVAVRRGGASSSVIQVP
ncbi:hypothetical protein TNCV_2470241 [Trichonephila clavipes]|nr:hypothetical protein TNCV_2470241 [Trichonephila clavipes]